MYVRSSGPEPDLPLALSPPMTSVPRASALHAATRPRITGSPRLSSAAVSLCSLRPCLLPPDFVLFERTKVYPPRPCPSLSLSSPPFAVASPSLARAFSSLPPRAQPPSFVTRLPSLAPASVRRPYANCGIRAALFTDQPHHSAWPRPSFRCEAAFWPCCSLGRRSRLLPKEVSGRSCTGSGRYSACSPRTKACPGTMARGVGSSVCLCVSAKILHALWHHLGKDDQTLPQYVEIDFHAPAHPMIHVQTLAIPSHPLRAFLSSHLRPTSRKLRKLLVL
jgi:hypothetical protein